MRLVVVGHSLVHERQHNFFRHVARLGHDVLLIAPATWGDLRPLPHDYGSKEPPVPPYRLKSTSESFTIAALPVVQAEGDMYRFELQGVERELWEFEPDILYIQQELECAITHRCVELARRAGWPVAVFVWENLRPLGTEARALLPHLDLLVAGNDAAGRIHEGVRNMVYLPQIGVDTAHFWRRPEVERDIDVGFIGRAVPEKGIEYLREAWPTAKIPPWRPWRELPWAYSHLKVMVNYSLDTPQWREQAMSYAAAEGLSSECAVVVSDGGAIPWWLGGGFCPPCPGAIMVPQHNAPALRAGIGQALERWSEMGTQGRLWVHDHLSNGVIAQRLLDELSLIQKGQVVSSA